MFDPTDEETAMSPKPFRATMTDVIKSGIDVPAAKNVRPMTYRLNTNGSQKERTLNMVTISIGSKEQSELPTT